MFSSLQNKNRKKYLKFNRAHMVKNYEKQFEGKLIAQCTYKKTYISCHRHGEERQREIQKHDTMI